MTQEERANETQMTLQARLESMLSIKNPAAEYYWLTLTGTEDGQICWSAQSVFAGWTDTQPKRELRVACKVDPLKALELLNSIGLPYLVVNELPDLSLYLHMGGHVIIRADIAENYLSDMLRPVEAVQSSGPGYVTINSISHSKLVRAPSKKLRMRVLKRDNYRCCVCGRSPDNYVDIELHVHHIRPRGVGGLTEEDNLITLCDTCHDGLDPHFDIALYSRIGIDPFSVDVKVEHKELLEGISNYRAIVRRILGQEDSQSE